jgi:hypothetical protein
MCSERKQSKMQTLGASNPHNNNKDKHRSGARITGETVDRVFTPGVGLDNQVPVLHLPRFALSEYTVTMLDS